MRHANININVTFIFFALELRLFWRTMAAAFFIEVLWKPNPYHTKMQMQMQMHCAAGAAIAISVPSPPTQ